MQITYDCSPNYGLESFTVESIDSSTEISHNHVIAAKALVRDCYAAQFEEPNGPLLQGSAKKQHDQTDIGSTLNVMRRSVDEGSQYFFLPTEISDKWDGLIKISPSRATFLQKRNISDPNLYIDDLLVTPSEQRHKLGHLLVHAALKYGGYKLDKDVVCDLIEPNADLEQYVSKFLRKEKKQPPQFKIAGQTLDQLRFTSQGTPLNIYRIYRTLETYLPYKALRVDTHGTNTSY